MIGPQNDVLLDGIGRPFATDIGNFFLWGRHKRTVMEDERSRLARELHDGVLQSLAGAALQLKVLSKLMDEDPEAAHERLRDIEMLMVEEQRELRAWIEKLKPSTPAAMASETKLAASLESLCRRVERQWGLRVNLTVSKRWAVSRSLGDEIYRVVQEGLTNIARHANARVGCVKIAIVHNRAHILLADDGCGFPFSGTYDLPTLTEKKLGPSSLKERVASLRGDLVLTSTPSGSRVEIRLPLRPRPLFGPGFHP